VLVVGSLLVACTDSPTDPPAADDSPEELEPTWLDQWVVPITTTDPAANDLSDLDGLADMVGEARLVGLGEATHGTREFFLLKHRLIRHLVEEQGFGVVGFEASWAHSAALNRYVTAGEGDPEELVKGLRLWPWMTLEVVGLVEWMRSFNQTRGGGDEVRFAGFDVQTHEAERDSVEAYMASVDPTDGSWVRARYSCFWGATKENWLLYGEAYRQECRDALRAVRQKLVDERDHYLAHTSEESYERALHAAEIILWCERYFRGENTRDYFMAKNAKWILEHGRPGEEMALWAHNGHISVDRPYPSDKAMGGFLDEAFGPDYVRVGFSFYEGSFNAVDLSASRLKPVSVGDPLPESVEFFLGSATTSPFLLDLRELARSPSPQADPVREKRLMRLVGATYDPRYPERYYIPLHLADQFDLVVFVRVSTPTSLF
jgi:erythromycin esterase